MTALPGTGSPLFASLTIGARTKLRYVAESDYTFLGHVLADRETTAFALGYVPVSISTNFLREMFGERSGNQHLIVEDLSGHPVGFVQASMWRAFHGSYAVSVVLSKESQGRGLGADARILHLRYLFYQLNARQVTGEYVSTNSRAASLNRRLGAEVCGLRRSVRYMDGNYVDFVPYVITRERFEYAVIQDNKLDSNAEARH